MLTKIDFINSTKTGGVSNRVSVKSCANDVKPILPVQAGKTDLTAV